MRPSRGGSRGGRGLSSRGGRRSAENSGDEAGTRKPRRVRFDPSPDGSSSPTGSIVKSINSAIGSNVSGAGPQPNVSSSKMPSSTTKRATAQKPRRGLPSNRKVTSNSTTARTTQHNTRQQMEAPASHNDVQPQSLPPPSSQSYPQRYQLLKKTRENERQEAIANGFLADPDKPRSLAEAITPVGTCPHMCPEFERVERVVQNDVWGAEYSNSSLAAQPSNRQPDESRMIKKFRRAAAGIDEQLPSDLRPPTVLRMTTDYLFNVLLREADSLPDVHHFIWDRTRAIRNDFSIQQLTKAADVRIAIECYERIARFHIVSLHQLALPEKPYDKYDAQQEREQLDKTLLSLMQYYDDNRQRLQSPNEAEFRAYCIIFQIQNPIPDLEDRIQTWPDQVVQNPRVQCALDLYAAACNVQDNQGPLKPLAPHPIAQGNWGRFWNLLRSNRISYLMSCVAEIYFPLVRRIALYSIWTTYRAAKRTIEDWSLEDLAPALGFDDFDDIETFCEHFGFTIAEREDGTAFLNLESVSGQQLPDPTPGTQAQRKSELVENKRHSRLLTAVINGMSVRAAREADLIEETVDQDQALDMTMDDEQSLFVSEGSNEGQDQQETKDSTTSTIDVSSWEREHSTNFVPNTSSGASNQPSAPQVQQPPNPQSSIFNIAPSDGAAASKKSDFEVKNPFASAGWNVQSKPEEKSAESNNTTGASIFSPYSSRSPTKPADYGTSNFFSQQPSSSYTPPAPTFSSQSNPFAFLSSANDPTKTSDRQNTALPQQNSAFDAPNSQKSLNFVSSPSVSSDPTTEKALSDVPSHGSFDFLRNTSKGPSEPSGSTSTDTSLFAPDRGSSTSSNSFQQRSTAPGANLSNSTDSKSLFDRFSKPTTSQTSASPSAPYPFLSFSNDRTTSLSDSASAFASASATSAQPFSSSNNVLNQSQRTSTSNHAAPSPTNTFNTSSVSQSPSIAPLFVSQQTADGTRLSKDTQASQYKKNNEKIGRKENKSETMDQLVRAFVTGPEGVLEQYAAVTINPLLKEIKESVTQERLKQTADEFRLSKLSHKFGRKWREIWWRRRLARQGRERRKRMIKHKEERERRSMESSISSTVEDFRQSLSSSHGSESDRGSPQEVDMQNVRSLKSQHAQPDVDASPPEVYIQEKANPPTLQDSRSNHRRSESVPENFSNSRNRRDFRQSSLRHSTLPDGSFLDGSPTTSRNISTSDTTRSAYFRLKALGLNPSDLTSSSDRKRPRSDSLEALTTYNPGKKLLIPSKAQSPPRNSTTLQPSRASSSLERSATEEDEELFAAVHQAKQAMIDSISFFKGEIAKDDELQRSRGSGSSPPSLNTSLQWKTSDSLYRSSAKRNSMLSFKQEEPPPAYRNRVSKFLPRESYADIQRQQRLDLSQRTNQMPLQSSRNSVNAGGLSLESNSGFQDPRLDHENDRNTMRNHLKLDSSSQSYGNHGSPSAFEQPPALPFDANPTPQLITSYPSINLANGMRSNAVATESSSLPLDTNNTLGIFSTASSSIPAESSQKSRVTLRREADPTNSVVSKKSMQGKQQPNHEQRNNSFALLGALEPSDNDDDQKEEDDDEEIRGNSEEEGYYEDDLGEGNEDLGSNQSLADDHTDEDDEDGEAGRRDNASRDTRSGTPVLINGKGGTSVEDAIEL